MSLNVLHGLSRDLTPRQSPIPHGISALVRDSVKLIGIFTALSATPQLDGTEHKEMAEYTQIKAQELLSQAEAMEEMGVTPDQGVEFAQISTEAQNIRDITEVILNLNFEALNLEFDGQKIASLDNSSDNFDQFPVAPESLEGANYLDDQLITFGLDYNDAENLSAA